MSTFLPAERGATIRMPSTANLMVDSADRDQKRYPDPADFQINKTQSIMNGFFTRIGLTEHIVEWNYPNLNTDLGSDTITFNIGGTDYPVTLTTGFYNVAEALDAVVAAANALPLPGVTLSVKGPTSSLPYTVLAGTAAFGIQNGGLANMLFPGEDPGSQPPSAVWVVLEPDLRAFRYLDFVSDKLTYNQDLKDDATNIANRTVLTRWYFSYDQPPSTDAYGYPILMGYTGFVLRRTFNPPKQIRWDSSMPIGQLEFKVYADPIAAEVWGLPGGLFTGPRWSAHWDWLATLQLSEV